MKRVPRIAGVAVAVALLLSGCGSDTTPTGTSAAPEPSTSAEVSAMTSASGATSGDDMTSSEAATTADSSSSDASSSAPESSSDSSTAGSSSDESSTSEAVSERSSSGGTVDADTTAFLTTFCDGLVTTQKTLGGTFKDISEAISMPGADAGKIISETSVKLTEIGSGFIDLGAKFKNQPAPNVTDGDKVQQETMKFFDTIEKKFTQVAGSLKGSKDPADLQSAFNGLKSAFEDSSAAVSGFDKNEELDKAIKDVPACKPIYS